MTPPTLTEIQHDGGDALTARPATGPPAATALLERLPDDATARARAAIRGGRKGRGETAMRQPLPEVKGTIAGALRAAHAALRARHAGTRIVHADTGWAIRDRAGTVLEAGAPPSRRPAHTPTWVATRHHTQWRSVDVLGDTVWQAAGEEHEALLRDSADVSR